MDHIVKVALEAVMTSAVAYILVAGIGSFVALRIIKRVVDSLDR